MVTAWFECDVKGRSLGLIPRSGERFHFGVRPPELLVPAFTHDFLIGNHHTADLRIRFDRALSPPGQLQGAAHELSVRGVHLTSVQWSGNHVIWISERIALRGLPDGTL